MEEGDGVKEEAGGEGVRAVEGEPFHSLVLLPWEELEQELFDLVTDMKHEEKTMSNRPDDILHEESTPSQITPSPPDSQAKTGRFESRRRSHYQAQALIRLVWERLGVRVCWET